MKLRYEDELLFASGLVVFEGNTITFDKILIDTGSAGTIFDVDQMISIGMEVGLEDYVDQVFGIGGSEFVFTRSVDRVAVGEMEVRDFTIEVGQMKYNIEIDGIIGLDFLMRTKAIIDLVALEIRSGQ